MESGLVKLQLLPFLKLRESNKFSKEQIDALYKYYPIRNWSELEKIFPNSSHKQIREAAMYRNIKQLHPNWEDISGQKFGKLTALYYDFETKEWVCECDCKKIKRTKISYLKSGHVKSCGCWNKTKYKQDNSIRLNSSIKDYKVYIHISPSKKVYIGITHQNFCKRFQNGKGYNRQKYFYSAIKKYGWNNFEHKILEDNLTYREAIEKEKYYIDVYNSTNPECGYNVSSGGFGVSDNGYPVAQLKEEQIINVYASILECSNELNISHFSIRKYIDDKKIHAGFKFIQISRQEYYNYSKKHSLNKEINIDFKEKIYCEKIEKLKINAIKNNSIYINQYTPDGKYLNTFCGINETEKLLNIHNISTAIKNNWLAGGFRWKRADGKVIIYDKSVSDRKIICITNGNLFNSGVEAAKWCGIKQYKSIYECCRNKNGRHSAGKIPNTNIKCQWMFYDEYLKQKIS
nr:MAG TPA: intron associated endonuclease [Caudoviricetes sp.]